MLYVRRMDALFQPYRITAVHLSWIATFVFVVAFAGLIMMLLYRASKMDQTGWAQESREDEAWRQYSPDVHPEPGGIPKRVVRQLLREYLTSWYGALHGLLLAASGIPAAALLILRHLG